MSDEALRLIVGQRFVTGLTGTEVDDAFREAVSQWKIGNAILFSHNVESREQLYRLCADIQALVRAETGHDAMITIDQEGGSVTRLKDDFAAVAPSAMGIASTGEPKNAYEAALLSARELAALGVNFNLAPVADVNSNPQNPVIGVRSYGDTTERVAEYVRQAVKGLADGHVLSAAKHFPGHGDTAVDSHLGLPRVDKSIDELFACELIPFQAAIEAGVSAIMSTHILFPQIDADAPATMSRAIITGLLRERLGFEGLIVSDCMMMNAIATYYGTVEGSMAALRAGVDLVFISHSAALCAQACEEAIRRLQTGWLSMEEMEASVARILRYKATMPAAPVGSLASVGSAEHRALARGLLDKAATCLHAPPEGMPALGDAPLFLGSIPALASRATDHGAPRSAFPLYLAERLGGEGVVTPSDPTDAEIEALAERARSHTCAVIGIVSAARCPGQLRLAQAIAQTGTPTVAVALREPYGLQALPPSVYAFGVYEYNERSLAVVADVLAGRLEPTGRLCVKL